MSSGFILDVDTKNSTRAAVYMSVSEAWLPRINAIGEKDGSASCLQIDQAARACLWVENACNTR